ncbi:MAG: hypothetical protein AAB513_02455 [Patescibacteria group bacterium]
MAQRNFHHEEFPDEIEPDPEYWVEFFRRNPNGKGYIKDCQRYGNEKAAESNALAEVEKYKKAVGAIVRCEYDDQYVKRCGFIPKRKDVI